MLQQHDVEMAVVKWKPQRAGCSSTRASGRDACRSRPVAVAPRLFSAVSRAETDHDTSDDMWSRLSAEASPDVGGSMVPRGSSARGLWAGVPNG
jgi:hypothetical protein